MIRIRLLCLVLASAPLLVSDSLAAGVNWWHDPQRGCGTLDGWQRTYRILDLPGCDGDLPKQAPPGEQAMHDAKRAFHEAEKILDSDQTADVEGKLEQATTIMNKAPNDPRVNWARPHYETALNILKKKLIAVPKLPKLRSAYKAAMDASEVASKQKTETTRKAAVAAADACVAAFREAESQNVDMSLPMELNRGKPRPLRDDQRDCAAGRGEGSAAAAATKDEGKAAAPVADGSDVKDDKPKDDAKPVAAPAAGGDGGGVPRAKWVKSLHGDRKKVFQDHEDAFPQYDGDPGPKGAAKAAEWHYGSEVFRFKKNKLLKAQ